MRRVSLVALALLVLVGATVVGAAGARESANEYAVGSAKTEIALSVASVGEQASFSARNTVGCDATGQIVYKNTALGLDFVAKIISLVIFVTGPDQASPFFAAEITKVKQGHQSLVGRIARFNAFDSGLGGPDGKGDQFELEEILTDPTSSRCLFPHFGHPITQGNIVIKAEPLLP